VFNLILKNVAHKDNLSAQSDTSLKDIIDLMNMNRKGVVVVLEGERPVGILTERDIVEILFNNVDLSNKVIDYAEKTLVSAKGSRTVAYAINLTLENNIRRVVVSDDSDNFIGVVTQQELLKYLEEDFYRLTIKVKHVLKNLNLLISVGPSETLHNVLKLMVANKISSVAILRNRKPIGIVTEKDVLQMAVAQSDLNETVEKHMSSPVDTANLDSALVDVVEVMNYKNIRRIIITDENGEATGILTIRDVVSNLEGDYSNFLERKLRSAKEVLNLLPEMLIEVTDTGEDQLIIWANDKVINRFGRGILGKKVTTFLPPDNWNTIYSTLNKLNKIENIKLKKDDLIYEISGINIRTDSRMEVNRFQLIMRDITEDVRLSTVDPLTNVYNKRFINEFLMKEIERSRRSNKQFSIVICDLDDFKQVNDNYGHLSGDIVLKSFSGIIASTIRNLDIVGRYGGDEFMIILPEASSDTAYGIIDRIRIKIENSEIQVVKKYQVKITASFGISTYPDDGMSSDDLLSSSDERLYKAKRFGKNKIAYS
jgi:diguanylate cyclase (GGDEF)-like protein